MNDLNLAKLAILDAYIGLLDAVICCARVKALVPLCGKLEVIAHDLNTFMHTLYDEPFKTALKRVRGDKVSDHAPLAPKRIKRAVKRV